MLESPLTPPEKLRRQVQQIGHVRRQDLDIPGQGAVSLICGEQNEADAGCAITRLRRHSAIGSPPQLGRSGASSAIRDDVED